MLSVIVLTVVFFIVMPRASNAESRVFDAFIIMLSVLFICVYIVIPSIVFLVFYMVMLSVVAPTDDDRKTFAKWFVNSKSALCRGFKKSFHK